MTYAASEHPPELRSGSCLLSTVSVVGAVELHHYAYALPESFVGRHSRPYAGRAKPAVLEEIMRDEKPAALRVLSLPCERQ